MWEDETAMMEGQEEHSYSLVVIWGSTRQGHLLQVGVNTEDVASLGLVLGMPMLMPALQYSAEIPELI